MDWLFALPVAVGLGMLHALEPGHGKGVMSAYLVSSNGKISDAILLGITAAVSHTFSILLLALISTAAIHSLLSAQAEHLIELIAGGSIAFVGVRLLAQQMHPKVVSLGTIGSSVRLHSVVHDHAHHHGFHTVTKQSRLKFISMGMMAGLIPCPSALAIFLATIGIGEIPKGISLVVAFSIGGAIVMSAIGIMVVKAGEKLERFENQSFVRLMSGFSSLVITALGLFITYRACVDLLL